MIHAHWRMDNLERPFQILKAQLRNSCVGGRRARPPGEPRRTRRARIVAPCHAGGHARSHGLMGSNPSRSVVRKGT